MMPQVLPLVQGPQKGRKAFPERPVGGELLEAEGVEEDGLGDAAEARADKTEGGEAALVVAGGGNVGPANGVRGLVVGAVVAELGADMSEDLSWEVDQGRWPPLSWGSRGLAPHCRWLVLLK